MRIHFIGIGGIGTSALAQYYLTKGHTVSGSDLVSSEITDALRKKGVEIFIGSHKPKCLIWKIKQPDLVIYSPAVPGNNLELKEAKKLRIKCLSYPEALGELTKKYFTIAISGTHGKSTTTAMIGLLLEKAGFDPTVIVGTKLKEFAPRQKNGGGSNCRVGKSKYLVIEADEWQASFLNYWPKIIVLTNIEREHLDYYKNLNNILKTYKKYISHLPKPGVLIANKDDENIIKIMKRKFVDNTIFSIAKNVVYFSLKQPEARNMREILKVPGEHNVYNALAALSVARILKIPDMISFKALSEYEGSWRRFEIKKFQVSGATLRSKFQVVVVTDYAHHPTEIKATILAAREKWPSRKLWVVFQPHQYQRTFYLFKDFVKVFSEVPVAKLIVTDIYDVAGREEKKIKEKVSAEKLIEVINKKRAISPNAKDIGVGIYLPKEKITKYLKRNLKGREVVIIMGAGDIYKLSDQI